MIALLVVLVGDLSGLPSVSWHLSQEACERRAEVEVEAAAAAGVGVEHVECRAQVYPRLRLVAGDVLR